MSFSEGRFLASMSRALSACSGLLSASVSPLSSSPHLYADKFAVAALLCAQTAAALARVLAALGLAHPDLLAQARGFAANRSVVLRFEKKLNCDFVRKQERRVQSSTTAVREYSTGAFSGAFKFGSSYKNVEFVWKLTHSWTLSLICGATTHVLQTREAVGEMLTATDDRPYVALGSTESADLIVNWALLGPFTIDRTTAVTPRRNATSEAALSFARELSGWARRVEGMLRTPALLRDTGNVDQQCLTAASLFVPVFPVLAPASPTLLPDLDALGDIHARSLAEKKGEVDKSLDPTALFSPVEGWLVVACLHLVDVSTQLGDGICHLEALLRKQLVDAIGRVVGPNDFAEYMKFHFARLFAPEFAPKPFCYAIRRPDHYPEGIISLEATADVDLSRRPPSTVEQAIEAGVCTFIVSGKTYPEQFWYLCKSCWSGENNGCCAACVAVCHAGHEVVPFKKSGFYCDCGAGAAPSPCRICSTADFVDPAAALPPPSEIETMVAVAKEASTWKFALTAAADIRFRAAPLLHGWIAPRFAQSSGQRLTLVARARQFSSFLVLLGRITGPNSFDPEHGFIVQNKDELSIPLDAETVPSAKEFREAIASISPEQQRFAKAFRAMQLESSLFAVCVIQIKPQMEKLLNLPNDALTKEIRLTQDLLELFVKYNIPSDLLSYHDLLNDDREPLDAVKNHVQSVFAMIEDKKKTEISDAAVGYVYSALKTGGAPRTPPGEAFGGFSFSASSPSTGMAPGASGGFGLAAGANAPSGGEGFGAAVASIQGANQQVVLKLLPPAKDDHASSIVVAQHGDYSKLPAALDAVLDKQDSLLRPTILRVSQNWNKKSQKGLLSNPVEQNMNHDSQVLERDKCNDLLDALSKSGLLEFDDVQLHLIMAVSHSFQDTLMDSLVIKNVNPIEIVENDALILAETIFSKPRASLIKPQ